MKTTFIICMFFLAAGCSKESSPACENWEVTEKCSPKAAGIVCGSDVYGKRVTVCGDELAGAKVGNTVVKTENANIKITYTYTKKL